MYIEGATIHGISCYQTVNQYIRGCKICPLVIPAGQTLYARPTITIGSQNMGGSIINNVTTQGFWEDGGTASAFTRDGNVVANNRTTMPPVEAYGTGWIGIPATGPSAWGRRIA